MRSHSEVLVRIAAYLRWGEVGLDREWDKIQPIAVFPRVDCLHVQPFLYAEVFWKVVQKDNVLQFILLLL